MDPVKLEVFINSLISIAEQMGAVIQQTARSTVVREAKDYSVGICDKKGNLVAEASYIPAHINTFGLALRSYLRKFPAEDLNQGDIIISNDPLYGPHHFSDIHMVQPVFVGNNIIAFVCNFAHHVDVGGRTAGSDVGADSIELFQEGLHIPPLKLFTEGKPNETVFEFIKANVRLPDHVTGDLNSQIAALAVGRKRVESLVEKYGEESVSEAMRQAMDYSERRARKNIDEIPEGEYEGEEYVDEEDTSPLRIHAKIRIEGDRVLVDFTGTDDQVERPINMYLPGTISTVYYVFRTLQDQDIPHNDGCFRSVAVYAPPGTILNPTYPAPCGSHHVMHHRTVDLLMKTLAQAVPDKVIAGSYGTTPEFVVSTMEDMKPNIFVDINLCGGMGARPTKDGIDATAAHTSNARNTPIEVAEAEYPVLFSRYALVNDSGGPGKFRGGLAACRELSLLARRARLSVRISRTKIPAFGLFGGKEGKHAHVILNAGTKRERRLTSRFTDLQIYRGYSLTLTPAAGGGYGDPLDREPKHVLRDVVEDKVSLRAAREHYGVVIDSKSSRIDRNSTRKLRVKLKRSPLK